MNILVLLGNLLTIWMEFKLKHFPNVVEIGLKYLQQSNDCSFHRHLENRPEQFERTCKGKSIRAFEKIKTKYYIMIYINCNSLTDLANSAYPSSGHLVHSSQSLYGEQYDIYDPKLYRF